jgi:hypothetical protein
MKMAGAAEAEDMKEAEVMKGIKGMKNDVRIERTMALPSCAKIGSLGL